MIPDGCMDLVWSDRGGLLVVGPNTSAFLAELPRRTPCATRAGAGRAPDPLVRAVAGTLADRPGEPLPRLARELGVSERQLRRRVVSQVGYGPKRLARVLRLRRALTEARAGAALAEAAIDAGYADQAHFTNDCRELAGLPPAAVLRS